MRRKRKSDEASDYPIFIRVKDYNSSGRWSTKGALFPGETLTIPLAPGQYRVEACIGEDLDEDDIEWEEDIDDVDGVDDSESETVDVTSNTTIRMTTRGWYGTRLYVDLDVKD